LDVNLKQLEAFIWVADLGSFRRAADRLNTTQPNISARISKLESALGITLMERDAGSVRLTARGRDMLDHARVVLRSTEALISASGRANQLDGTLRLGVTEMIVHTWLRELLKQLRDDYPNVTVELTVDMSANLEGELHQRSIDLALQNAPFSRQTSGNIALGTYPLVWVAAPGLALPARPRAEDLAMHPILTHARHTRLYQEIAAHFAHAGGRTRLVPSSNLASCIYMVSEGMGIAALPAAMVVRELARCELVQVGYKWVPDSLRFHARYDAEKAPLFVASAAKIAARVARLFDAD